MKNLKLFRGRAAHSALIAAAVLAGLPMVVAGFTRPTRALPVQIEARGVDGVPHGIGALKPTLAQTRALQLIGRRIGVADLRIQYNGLTATPHLLSNPAGYLTRPSTLPAETVARSFLSDSRDLYRFSDEDLDGLRARSQSTLADTGSTVLMLQQTVGGVPVFQGDVIVNVSKSGQVISAGDDSFPQLSITNKRTLSEADAVAAAGRSFGLSYTPVSLGTKKVLETYGQLQPSFVDAANFSGNSVFSDEIAVTPTIFPLGSTGRQAWEFIVVTPQFQGVMWQFVVDAETGVVLRRVSLTHFVSAAPGGGVGVGRRATFRPDVQDLIETLNTDRSAAGMTFDTHPVTLSAAGGTGRSVRSGTAPNYVYKQPTYDVETGTTGFRYSLLQARNEEALPFMMASTATFDQSMLADKLGQVLRGFPDATHGSASSPFGWFYLPTGANGAEITDGDVNRAATEAFGYTMDAAAVTRNKVNPANSPVSSGTQPYSATVTSLPGPVTVADGRTLSRVIQSNYTEGNNVFVSDDRANDNDSTLGIRGYSATRQFTAPYFLFSNSYEFGGTDASSNNDGSVTYPATADADVFPDTVALFFGNNIEHDYLYSIGFTEANWNFQQDNFGKGGAGGDAVSAQVQDGSGTDNANFGTPADGSRPTMQMYLFTDAGLRRSDGAFDWDVYAHEYYHGVSTRSAGKGSAGCLVAGIGLTGEAGGQGEGWSDTIASSLADDENEGEYVTGAYDVGIRHMPYSNYRWSYGSLNGTARNVRRLNNATALPDGAPGSVPFEVHDVGEVWASTLWDMRELFIMKNAGGVFFDKGRTGTGTTYYIGSRAVQSADAAHPIDYRASFADTTTDPFNLVIGISPTYKAAQAVVRPGLLATEIQNRGDRQGPIASAVAKGGRLADTLVLRGLQLGVCQPSMIDSRDSILAADTELTGGENRSLIWRAMASHGIGNQAASTSSTDPTATAGAAPVTVEDFTVPAGVTACETMGPLPAPSFRLGNTKANTVTVVINGGTAVTGANKYLISRATSATGPFVLVANVPAATTSYDDTGLLIGQVYYYQVRAARDANGDCVSQFDQAATQNITLTVGTAPKPSPVFAGVAIVDDPAQCTVLNLSWLPATSISSTAKIVYDIYRVGTITPGNGLTAPTFTPSTANLLKKGVTTTAFADTTVTRNQIYYYIVQARDADNGTVDTTNVGNTVVKFNAASSSVTATTTPPFALETYEAASADNRFVPPLMDEAAPNIALLAWQRVSNADLGGGQTSGVMYAPDVDPTNGGVTDPVLGITVNGVQSDNSTMIGPITLTADSVLQYDSRINSENSFDGGVVELSLVPVFNSTPYPDNTTTFDLGDHMVAGGYNGALDGPSAAGAGYGSLLMGRRAYTGTRGLKHTRIPLKDFAPGGAYNATGGTVYIRFRMTTDVLSNVGPTSGWYIDNLSITDAAACPIDKAPLAVLTATPTMGYGPLAVSFDGSGSSDPDAGDAVATYVFDFGDGSGISQISPTTSHTYGKGTYTASLKVQDKSGMASALVSQVITVLNNAPVAAITANPTTQGKGKAVAFDASGTTDADGDAIASYTFDFGDGTSKVTQTGATVSHTYAKSGSYTVSVIASDGTDNSNAATTTVTITNAAPTAALAASPVSGTVPFTVTFDASGSSDPDTGDQVQFYHFDFGDGSSTDASQPSVTHQYTAAGSYTATVKVYDNENTPSANVGMAMIAANSPANTAPVAQISATPASGTAPLNVTFDASKSTDADGDALTYVYDFGDGSATVTQTTAATVQHSYSTAGTYTASVTVTDGRGGSSKAMTTVQATTASANDTPPVARLSGSPTSGTATLTVVFDASTSTDADGDALSYVYDFGDGSATVSRSTSATVQHDYTMAGNNTATVTVNDGRGGTSTASTAIRVTAPAAADVPPVARLTLTPASGSVPLSTVLDPAGTTDADGDALTYIYDFGDGTAVVMQSSAAVITHVYATIGNFTATLTVNDGRGGMSKATAVVQVLPPVVPIVSEGARLGGGAAGIGLLLPLLGFVGLRRRRRTS